MRRQIILLGTLLCGATAYGADLSGNDAVVGQWYLSPEVGATIVDPVRHVGNGAYYGLAFGKHISEDWSAEINAISGTDSGRYSGPGVRISALSADILRVFSRDTPISPFLTAGLGGIRDAPDVGNSRDNFMAQGGLGAFVHLWQSSSGAMSFSLRPEAKIRWDTNTFYHRPIDVLVGISFDIGFGAPHAPEAAPPPPPPPPPAPPPPPPQAAPVPPAPAAAPAPPRGSITLVGVHFENNSAKLTPESSNVLDPLAEQLKAYPRLRVEIQGHTDSNGSGPYNMRLSEARANAVRDYLIGKGVSPDELTAKGYGKTQPIADNKTAEGRAQNRRVVMQVLENPSDVSVKGGADQR